MFDSEICCKGKEIIASLKILFDDFRGFFRRKPTEIKISRLNPSERFLSGFGAYTPMHEVVPSAVSIAEIIEAMICSVHFKVSFFVISNKL